MPALGRGRRRERFANAVVRLAHAGDVDAQVELRQVQPEDLHTAAEEGEPPVGDPLAAVRPQAGVDQVELAEQLVGRAEGVVAQSRPDRRQPPPVGLVDVLCGRDARRLSDGGIRLDDRRRHPPRAREGADLALEELARTGTRLGESRFDRRAARVRVAIEVASDPGPEPEWREPGGRQPRLERREHARRSLPQSALEEPERLPDLVDDARAVRADLVGLPEDGDLLREIAADAVACRRGQVRSVELVQERRDASVLLQHRSP